MRENHIPSLNIGLFQFLGVLLRDEPIFVIVEECAIEVLTANNRNPLIHKRRDLDRRSERSHGNPFGNVFDSFHSPPLWNLAQFGILEPGREQGRDVRIHAIEIRPGAFDRPITPPLRGSRSSQAAQASAGAVGGTPFPE